MKMCKNGRKLAKPDFTRVNTDEKVKKGQGTKGESQRKPQGPLL
jgi:hypothetical protein